MSNKKIGIMTMHKVLNYGSALQAYATQKFIEKSGYKCELIDFLYPVAKKKKSIKDYLVSLLPSHRNKRKKFKEFWIKHLKTSKQTFVTQEELTAENCKYDIYLTGSDQVWNPKLNDEVYPFMFNFIEGGKKLSFAASFSSGNVNEEKRESYSRLLSQYQHISVREASGVPLVKELTGKNATHVCDPTFLLDNNEWEDINNSNTLKINGPYILIYILSYAYNPYPHVFDIIEKVRKELGYKVLFIDGSLKYSNKEGYENIRGCGPADFIYLIRNAAFVITTSFHGTAFAINFRRPLLSVIQPDLNKDSRMYSLLKMVGLEARAVVYNQLFDYKKECETIYTQEVNEKINKLVADSKKFLTESLAEMSK